MTKKQFIKKNASSFFCTPTYSEEIINIVKKANSKKSSGFDNVDPHIIKQIILHLHCAQHCLEKRGKMRKRRVLPTFLCENGEFVETRENEAVDPHHLCSNQAILKCGCSFLSLVMCVNTFLLICRLYKDVLKKHRSVFYGTQGVAE